MLNTSTSQHNYTTYNHNIHTMTLWNNQQNSNLCLMSEILTCNTNEHQTVNTYTPRAVPCLPVSRAAPAVLLRKWSAASPAVLVGLAGSG